MGGARAEDTAGPSTRAGLSAGGRQDIAFLARGRVLMNRWVDKVKLHVADVRIVDLPGAGHYAFLTRESEVLREIHAFVASLAR